MRGDQESAGCYTSRITRHFLAQELLGFLNCPDAKCPNLDQTGYIMTTESEEARKNAEDLVDSVYMCCSCSCSRVKRVPEHVSA